MQPLEASCEAGLFPSTPSEAILKGDAPGQRLGLQEVTAKSREQTRALQRLSNSLMTLETEIRQFSADAAARVQCAGVLASTVEFVHPGSEDLALMATVR